MHDTALNMQLEPRYMRVCTPQACQCWAKCIQETSSKFQKMQKQSTMMKTRRCIHRGPTWKRTSGAAARASAAVMCTMCHLLPEGVGKGVVRDPRQTSTGVYLTPLLPTNILAPACKACNSRSDNPACRYGQQPSYLLRPDEGPLHCICHYMPSLIRTRLPHGGPRRCNLTQTLSAALRQASQCIA